MKITPTPKVKKVEENNGTASGKGKNSEPKIVNKGKDVAIEGKLTHRSYDDKAETNVISEKFCE